MNRRKFTKTITGSVVAALAIPLIVNADQVKCLSKNEKLVLRLREDYSRVCGINAKLRDEVSDSATAETLAELKGFDRGYYGCLEEIRRQTKFSSKKCYEQDGVMYIAGIRGRVL